MASFLSLTSRLVPLPVDNVDTDQIIPARFLKVTDKNGLAEGLFYDWRQRPDFVLNQPESAGAQILLAGDNFGCGSSREHAPWALLAGGFRAVISTSFADIFCSNALKNGLLPVSVDATTMAWLSAGRADDLSLSVTIDLEAQRLEAPSLSRGVDFSVDPFARRCLLEGTDQLGYLMSFLPEIERFEGASHA